MWLLGISLSSSTNLLEILVIYFSQKSCKVFLMSQIFVACPAEVPLWSLPPFVLWLFRFLSFSQHRAHSIVKPLLMSAALSHLIQPWENYMWPVLFVMPHSLCPSFASSAPSCHCDELTWPFAGLEIGKYWAWFVFICWVGVHKIPGHFVVPQSWQP